MSLLLQHKALARPPRLTGKQELAGSNPAVAKVKGVMFGGRKQFLNDIAGEAAYADILTKLSPATAALARTPLATSWCDFASLIELDRAIHDALHKQYPNVLALIGAASAELGIGRVYKSLDSAELLKFLENQAMFHSQFQKFGNVRFEKSTDGGRMICSGYPVYSPIYCASAVGFYLESILRHGGNDPQVIETKCQTLGDAECVFDMTWR
jgi:predicted hydrocarbon binding protein